VRGGFARDDWNARYAGSELLWTAEPNRRFVSEVEALDPGRALELACGEGRNTVWLAERGWRVTGVDFSEVALAKAVQLAASRDVEVEWVLADVLEYAPARGAFDLVAVLYLHLPHGQLARVLRSVRDALAPEGTLVVLGHDTTNLTDGHGGPRDASVLFTPEDVVQQLEGLVVECAETVRRTVSLEDGEATAIDALVRARRPR
jgi:SAM-dependent methyltransferase